jgi:predicted acyltransferase (DUF342 family)
MERTHSDYIDPESSVDNATSVIVNVSVKNDAPIGELATSAVFLVAFEYVCET